MPKRELSEETMQKRGKWLCRAGWAAFAASFALPVMPGVMQAGSFFGWDCLVIVYQTAWGVLTLQNGWSDGWALYYAGFALTNSIMFLSPFVQRRTRDDRKRTRRWAAVVGGAALYTLSYLILGIWPRPSLGGLNVGFYAWQLSFVLAAIGVLHLSVQTTSANQRPTSSLKTQDELAAERELEEYLGKLMPNAAIKPSTEAESEPEPLRTQRRATAT